MTKPQIIIDLDGESGNIFFVIGLAIRALENNEQFDIANNLYKEVDGNAKDYEDALRIIEQYVHIIKI